MKAMVRPMANLSVFLWGKVRDFMAMIGGMSLLFFAACSATLKSVFVASQRISYDALFMQMVRVGIKAIPIVILVQMAVGMILPLQMFPKLDEFGQSEQIATINGIAAFRELGPLMTAIVLCGFAGASIAAELGTMVTSEEIEAMVASAISPVRFLVIPRMLATVLMMVMLTIMADLVMTASGMFTSYMLGIDPDAYYQLTIEAVDVVGFVTGLIKAAVFGLLIGLIACFQGLSVKSWDGSVGVGQATTQTVVYGIVAIIGADVIFTLIFYAYGLF